MNILIAYASRYGTTAKCAKILEEKLTEKGHKVTVADIKENKNINPAIYDRVAVGGSFVAFRMNSFVKKFVKRNLKTLLSKKVGVFMCGADNIWEEEIKKGFPEELLDKAIAKAYFGYEMNWEKMNPMIRGMMQKASKTTESVSKINNDNIYKFAEDITS
ncbi:MAG: flavodoxin domain-containing protein [Actinomycetota bacterium]|nr:flavodoxin domain-containing protein [Actinomycetota bacterium]